MLLFPILLFCCIGLLSAYSKRADKDLVDLPGAEGLNTNFKTFSGYLEVGTKNMHYIFVESMNDPKSDPIAFWTNGGPGCSGLLGFFAEQGPFRPTGDMKLELNAYAWNSVANMVFIESPCGVGYSYSDDPEDYTADDGNTAALNYELIVQFFDRFPEYRESDLYLSSESYGGRYMPTLAREIILRNRDATNKLNFKGFSVGNPFVNYYSGMPALVETAWGHQLVAEPTMKQYRSNWCSDSSHEDYQLEACEAILNDIFLQFGDLNPYALDFPICTEDRNITQIAKSVQRRWLVQFLVGDARSSASSAMTHSLSSHLARISSGTRRLAIPNYEPCEEDYMSQYLNLPEVKDALHVRDDIEWRMCSSTLRYKHTDSELSVVGLYKELLEDPANIKILVYSGDDDGVCGTVGTQEWIWDLGFEVASPSDKWQIYSLDEQLVGFQTKWKDARLGFVTIHGAGHEVPTYRPGVALDMWIKFLRGDWTD